MSEFLSSLPIDENGMTCRSEFITCLNGYPQASAGTLESAIALAQEFRLFTSEQTLSIYEVSTGIHYDLGAMMVSKLLQDHMLAS